VNVLILGGSGMFGRKTILHMVQDPEIAMVVSMDMVPPPEWFLKSIENYKSKFAFFRGSVTEFEDCMHAIDRVVNWAFIMVGGNVKVDPRLITKVNIMGMSNAFEAAKLIGANRVIYASSQTVYGSREMYGDRDVTEDDQTNPTFSYAVCKKYAEILANDYVQQFGMQITGVRPTIGYGHGGRSPAQWWSDMPSAAAVGKPYHMDMDGTSLASLVSADDLGIFTTMLVKAKSAPHPVYNVGSPPTSVRQLADAVKKFIPDAKITFGNATSPMGRGGLWQISGKRALEDFGFSCMPIEEAILIHINDARLEAGLPPIKAKK
jgi:nucleoside-diphosphate-sugar epimerase